MLQRPSRIFSSGERQQIILVALCATVLWPWAPDRILGEHFPVNPRQVIRLVVILAAIQIAGHVVLRWFGPRLGLSLAGLVSGFVSSTATHAAMGAQARTHPVHGKAYASAAVLSNVATALQAMLMVSSIATTTWASFAPYLLAMAAMAIVCGIVAFARVQDIHSSADESRFSIKQPLIFAGLLTLISALSAFIQHEWGQTTAWIVSGLAAFVDVHVAIASLASQSSRADADVTIPLLICLTINAFSKAVISWMAAGRSRFTMDISLYLALITGAPWCIWWLTNSATQSK
jgi:uncharacterized membrane protein (DUF4010 family)